MRDKDLVDNGFDTILSSERVNNFEQLFTSEKILQNFISEIHETDGTLDLKRGEFYPEILRCIMTLKVELAKAYDLSFTQCQPNFGSNGSIDTILTAVRLGVLGKKGKTVMVSTPTYFRNYNSTLSRGFKLLKIPLCRKTWNIDLELFLREINQKKPDVIMLVSPNNPTGISIRYNDLIEILKVVQNESLVIIDRTLADIEQNFETKEILRNFSKKNIVILHSLSKYLGLSHLRIGYALYSNKVIAKKIQPFLPLGIGIEGAIRTIKYLQENNSVLEPSLEVITNIKESKKKLMLFCKENPQYSITDFTGNYCLFFLPENSDIQTYVEHLQKHGVYVMGGNEFPEPMDNVIRLHTGGNSETIDRFIYAMTLL